MNYLATLQLGYDFEEKNYYFRLSDDDGNSVSFSLEDGSKLVEAINKFLETKKAGIIDVQ